MRKILISSLLFASLTSMIYSCQNAGEIKQDVYYVNGRDLYIKHCQNCHGSKGEGLAELSPPLTDTVFFKENRQKLACIIKNGMKDSIVINRQPYQGNMPAFPELYDIDIAQLLVYIGNSFGNKLGMFTPKDVAADLKRCK